jgi:type II secretory pathway component PulF
MPAFAVRAVDDRGQVTRTSLEAPSADALRARLVGEGVYPISIEPQATHSPERRAARGTSVPAVARQLAALLEAEVPLAQALELAAEAAPGETERAALRRVLKRVEDGGRLAEALAGPPALFPPVGVGIVAAGERSGSLAAAFGRLADYLEHRHEQRRRLLAALSYPLFMLLAGLAACAVLVAVVLPRFSEMLAVAGVELPATTAILLGTGDVLADHGLWLGSGLAGGAAVAALAVREERVRHALHGALLSFPLSGRLRRSMAAVHSGQALSSQLSEGVSLLSALESTAAASADLAVRDRLRSAAGAIRAGSSLSAALDEADMFPRTFVRMVRIGERSGAVAALMHRAALLEEQELDRRLERLIRYAEPAMIIGFGGFIGFIALALLQAVYGMHGGIAP